eukprot:scaffold184921_cov69-Cyclotella_meneghiniana.AAC.1
MLEVGRVSYCTVDAGATVDFVCDSNMMEFFVTISHFCCPTTVFKPQVTAMPADIDSYKLNKIFTTTPGDLSAEQQELLNEVKATKTTPRDPRFPTQNQGEYKKHSSLVLSNLEFSPNK